MSGKFAIDRMRHSGATLLAVGILCVCGMPARTQPAFHAPQTEPERVLEKILRRADKDEHLLDNLLQGRGAKNFRPKVDYHNLLTPGLIEAIRAHEKALVAKDCNGRYLEGEICGLDYSPITCGQDIAKMYEFRTVQAEPEMTRIDFRWAGGKTTAASYRLVKADGQWKIDGISCTGASAFNMR